MMEVFYHNLYEYQKNLRELCLCTLKQENRQKTENRLKKEKIAYLIHDIGLDKINVFFGNKVCVDVIKTFNKANLNELTPEQDFILGIMLGYGRAMQCQRYLKHLSFACKSPLRI